MRQRLDIDSTWLPGRGRVTARRRVCEQSLPQGVTFASDHLETRAPSLLTATHGAWMLATRAQAPERAARHNGSSLTALRATELLISCTEARWCQCSAPCVVRTVVVWCQQLATYWTHAPVLRHLGDCWLLRDVLLGFLPGSKRTARLDSIPGEVLRALSGPCRTRGPSLEFSCPALLLSQQRCVNVLVELALDLFKLGILPSASPRTSLGVGDVSCRWHELRLYGGVFRQRWFRPQMRSCPGSPTCGAPLSGGSVPPQHRRVAVVGHAPQQQGCSFSKSCHFALFVNPVARSSTDEFFTLCGAHLHERTAQAASLQRRDE